MTTAVSRSSFRTGPSPAAGGSKASCAGPTQASAPPSGSSTSLPLRGELAERAARLEERRCRPSGPSATSSSTAPTPRPRRAFGSIAPSALRRASRPPTRHTFCFDPAVIDWRRLRRARSICPRSSSTPASAPPRGKRTMASREERSLKAILSEQPRCAAFDLENTLIASNVVESYAWLATRHLDRTRAGRVVAGLFAEGPKPAPARPPRSERLPSRLLPAL